MGSLSVNVLSSIVQKLLSKLRIPLYPYAEPNTTYLSFLQQGCITYYEVDPETEALESIEFVKKPPRVVSGPLHEDEEVCDDERGEECRRNSVNKQEV